MSPMTQPSVARPTLRDKVDARLFALHNHGQSTDPVMDSSRRVWEESSAIIGLIANELRNEHSKYRAYHPITLIEWLERQ